MTAIAQQKLLVCEIGHRMWQRGLVAGFDGNLSVRIGSDRVLCTPSGVAKGFLKPAQLCLIKLDGSPLAGGARVSSEVLLHLQIYQARPEVGAVVHAHPPHATAFACTGRTLPEGIYPEADYMLGPVVRVPYILPGTPAVGAAVVAAMKGKKGVTTAIMGNHGTVHVGKNLEEAYCYLEVLEAYCRILETDWVKRGAIRLTRRQFRELMELKIAKGGQDSRLGALRQSKPNFR